MELADVTMPIESYRRRTMKKYSVEWKQAMNKKNGGWAQYNRSTKSWEWHYIEFGTEYRRAGYLNEEACINENDTHCA
jgi:hypothetical protein